MNYKRKKNLHQKLHLENTRLNYKFFIIIQLKSINTYQWSLMANELLKYNFKVKAFSTRLLHKNACFIPVNLARVCLSRKQKMYGGKIGILYPTNSCLVDIKQVLHFLEATGFALFLFAFVNERFLGVPSLKKIANISSKTGSLQIIGSLLYPIISLIGTLQLVNKQQ
ncbi:hypothetical protein HAM_017 (mitochondrion) [Hemiselmis andersenii]|uniref:Uncharacterized protein n=1 Tax=Hemiselmis andersenii TaxID=464988 RepID=B2MWT1_HEMAN|nr:hypothetical protein HAM_017 [Hemiselmis andersenii]ACC78223.1 hypothetical protein HAM_017 [Hemiselmis andersenii]